MTEEIDRSNVLESISLGAGVQSTVMLLLAINKDERIGAWLDRMGYGWPTMAVFADTGNEPKGVYEHLERLRKPTEDAGIELEVVQFDDIIERTLRAAKGERGFQVPCIPWFVVERAGPAQDRIDKRDAETGEKTAPVRDDLIGQNSRGCTTTYKIEQIQKCLLRKCGIMKHQRKPKNKLLFRSWVGISRDEASRMKPARKDWEAKCYPLIEALMWSRTDCYKYLDEHWPYPVTRSACIVCPYHNNRHWQDMKDNHPEDFEAACQFDEGTRNMPGFRGELYLHADRKPLRDVVFDSFLEGGGVDMFQNECEGGCGL